MIIALHLEETIMLEESLNNLLIEDESTNESPSKLKKFFEGTVRWLKTARDKIVEFIKNVIGKVKSVYNKLIGNMKGKKFTNERTFNKRVVKVPRSHKWHVAMLEGADKLSKLAYVKHDAVSQIKEVESNIEGSFKRGRELIDFQINSNNDLETVKGMLDNLKTGINSLNIRAKNTIRLADHTIKINEAVLKAEELAGTSTKVTKKEIKNATEVIRVLNSILNKASMGLLQDMKIYNSILNNQTSSENNA